jgi:uncharacterized protein (DUF983 family)
MTHWKVGPGGICPRCGEDRITTRVEDKRGVRSYCDVCAYEWRDQPKGKDGG